MVVFVINWAGLCSIWVLFCMDYLVTYIVDIDEL